jgi:hypothetical protein
LAAALAFAQKVHKNINIGVAYKHFYLSIAKYLYSSIIKGLDMEAICTKCGVPLTNSNWWPSNRNINKHVCNACVNKSMVERGIYKKYHARQRERALGVIANGSKIECINCHCADLRLLEINHKNGGGRHEFGDSNDRNKRALWRFYRDIISGKRSTDDLEITCRVCNALHYLQSKYGPLPFTIVWAGPA